MKIELGEKEASTVGRCEKKGRLILNILFWKSSERPQHSPLGQRGLENECKEGKSTNVNSGQYAKFRKRWVRHLT